MRYLSLDDRKYVIEIPEVDYEHFRCFRNGDEWRDLTGDKLVLSLCQRIETLEKELSDAWSLLRANGLRK